MWRWRGQLTRSNWDRRPNARAVAPVNLRSVIARTTPTAFAGLTIDKNSVVSYCGLFVLPGQRRDRDFFGVADANSSGMRKSLDGTKRGISQRGRAALAGLLNSIVTSRRIERQSTWRFGYGVVESLVRNTKLLSRRNRAIVLFVIAQIDRLISTIVIRRDGFVPCFVLPAIGLLDSSRMTLPSLNERWSFCASTPDPPRCLRG